jgi:DNA polymerase-3 subunit alpha
MTGVVRKIREITARDGARYAFIAFSDPTGEFETMVLGENIPQMRDVLSTGKAYIFRARVRWRDSEMRISTDAFEPMEAAEARVGGELKIVVREGGGSLAVLADTFKTLQTAGGQEGPAG